MSIPRAAASTTSFNHALVLLADGFEEIEAVTIIDVLRRAEVKVTAAALGERTVRGVHDIVLEADARLDDLDTAAFDALILPGGTPGAKRLRDDPRVLQLVKAFARDEKTVAAICAAPIVLEAAGVLGGRRATSYPGFDLPSARVQTSDRVVQDGQIVTSRGPGTALDFALTLAERARGTAVARALREDLLVA